MATQRRRLTFAVTPEAEAVLDEARKLFGDCSESELIRTLVAAGLAALKEEREKERKASSA